MANIKHTHQYFVWFSSSCVEAILAANVKQREAEDPVYGGTPLHWAKNAEVSSTPQLNAHGWCFAARFWQFTIELIDLVPVTWLSTVYWFQGHFLSFKTLFLQTQEV